MMLRTFCISPNAGKYGPEKTPYLDTFHAMLMKPSSKLFFELVSELERQMCILTEDNQFFITALLK